MYVRRATVFAHCVDIVLADGQLLKPEADARSQVVVLGKLNDIGPGFEEFFGEALSSRPAYRHLNWSPRSRPRRTTFPTPRRRMWLTAWVRCKR